MLNAFGIILIYEMMWCFDGQNIDVEIKKPMFNPPY
jgi:hypothetical protein